MSVREYNAVAQEALSKLAAERERHDRAQERATKWFDLLSAEREKRNRLIAEWSKDARSAFELRDQLDAERDCSKRFEVQVDDCQQQLAAELEKVQTLVDAINTTSEDLRGLGMAVPDICDAIQVIERKIKAALAKVEK